MKTVRTIAVFCITCTMIVYGCNDKDCVTGPLQTPINLIPNPSFESNGVPLVEGWKGITDSLEHSAPPGGGEWSLKLEATWFPGRYVETIVPAPPGGHQYRFSFWGKHGGTLIGGTSLYLKHIANLTSLNFVAVLDTSWTYNSVLFTLTTAAQDSFVIRLSGGATEIIGGQTYFDLCKLEQLD